MTHYGMSQRQAIYFTAHAEADLVQHEEHMGHGPMNRMILQRIVGTRIDCNKLGYDPKYCGFTMVDLHALMERHALENPYQSDNPAAEVYHCVTPYPQHFTSRQITYHNWHCGKSRCVIRISAVAAWVAFLVVLVFVL